MWRCANTLGVAASCIQLECVLLSFLYNLVPCKIFRFFSPITGFFFYIWEHVKETKASMNHSVLILLQPTAAISTVLMYHRRSDLLLATLICSQFTWTCFYMILHLERERRSHLSAQTVCRDCDLMKNPTSLGANSSCYFGMPNAIKSAEFETSRNKQHSGMNHNNSDCISHAKEVKCGDNGMHLRSGC